MEEISKIYALVLDRDSGNGGNCKVVSLIRNEQLINDEEIIKKYVKSNGRIYSNIIFQYISELNIGDLVEIEPSEIIEVNQEYKNYYVRIRQLRKTGFKIYDLPAEYFGDNYINLEEITKYFGSRQMITKAGTSFYLCDNQFIYGPFRFDQGEIQPKVSTYTFSFEYNVNELIESEERDTSWILQEPKKKLKEIDCMTELQLIKFLKGRISVDNSELNKISKWRKEIDNLNHGLPELDTIRLNRASDLLKYVELSVGELTGLLQKDDSWNTIVSNTVAKYSEEFKKNALIEIETEIEIKRKTLDEITENIKKQNKKLKELDSKIGMSSEELTQMEEKKEEFILNLRILSRIGILASKSKENSKPPKAMQNHELIIIPQSEIVDDIIDYYDILREQKIRVSNQQEYEDALLMLKEKKFHVAESSNFVINTISHLGQVEYLLQNAEPSWISYNTWRNNGMDMFLSKAVANPNTNFFYILQDFNLANIECYGKPIIDISNKTRICIPGTDDLWPDNFYIILVTADQEIEDFSFEINPTTFRNWGYFPYVGYIEKIKLSTDYCINLDKLRVNRNFKDYSHHYL